jgi:class 3 adenylate cyclase
MDVPDVRYARAGGVAVAYQVAGDAARTLVFAPHLCDIFNLWRTPYIRRFLDAITRELRVVVFNARGTGLSDRPRAVTLEARMDDIGIVLDALDLTRAALLGVATGGNACALFAATHPERCDRLVLASAYPRAVRSDAYPHGPTEEEHLTFMREIGARWGDRDFLEGYFRAVEPEVADRPDDAEASLWQHRLAVSPAGAVDFWRLNLQTDITDVLPSIRVPTLVLHGERDRGAAGFLVRHIRGAEEHELHELAGSPYSMESARTILGFLRGDVAPAIPDSVLATVMFTDLVGSTERATALGDRAWRELLARHHAAVRSELARYRGVELDVAGDGFFCRFDGPARAIACGRAIVDSARPDALDVRVGIHTGECELLGDKVAGIAVVTGARISALARPGEVLVSRTVKDLVAGSGLAFEERGEQELKGVPGTWRLYAVVDA